jgi:CheY-like chemotaxis protein
VVDDEEMVRLVVSDYLEMLGYSVESAADGDLALERLRQAPEAFGLVLLDLTMPTLGGDEVLRIMKAEKLEVPVLLSSGFAIRDLPKGLAETGTHFLQKPYPLAALEAKVRELFKG